MERVEASVFDGKKLARNQKSKTNKDLSQEFFDRADRRVGKNTTVMVDGFAISKESMNCGEWEAVPTFAGKDPRLAEPKRTKKAAVEPQSHCQVCFDGGELHCCQLCPRAFHYACLDTEFKSKAKGWQFNCPQHECSDCSQKTTDAGGMLYRCRWCERAYCEDCLDFEKAVLVGNNLIEYELLGYDEMTQAFYVQCHACTQHFEESPKDKAYCENLVKDFELEYERRVEEMEREVELQLEPEMEREMSTRAGSLTDATTVETPGANTPFVAYDDDLEYLGSISKKRKMKTDGNMGGSSKRERLGV